MNSELKTKELIANLQHENSVTKWEHLFSSNFKTTTKTRMLKLFLAFILTAVLAYLHPGLSTLGLAFRFLISYFALSFVINLVITNWFIKEDIKPSDERLIELIEGKIEDLDDEQNRWIKALKTVRLCPELVQMEIYDNDETILTEIKKTQEDILLHKSAVEYLEKKTEEVNPGSGFTTS